MRSSVLQLMAVSLLLCGFIFSPAVAFDKNQARVLAAFRPSVAEASKSTVRIYSDGKRSALGVVVDKEGYVLTKASEVRGKVECQLVDGRRGMAKIVGVDRKLDLAMLRTEWTDLQPVAWSEEVAIDRGSWLVTPGIEEDLIVGIGVVSATSRPIPRANGALGIRLVDAPNGGGIGEVMPKTPAEKAGLQAGDVVVRVSGKEVKSIGELQETVFAYEPGDEVTLTVKRGSDSFDVTLTLGNFQQMINGERAEFQNSLGGSLSQRRAGFSLVLQHDTVLKPQDCGGPLLDIEGKAVGVNIARAGRVETYALPTSVVRPILDDMKAGKYAPSGSDDKPLATTGK